MKARRNNPTVSEQPSTTDPAESKHPTLTGHYSPEFLTEVPRRSHPPGEPPASAIGFHVEKGGVRSSLAATTPTPARKGGVSRGKECTPSPRCALPCPGGTPDRPMGLHLVSPAWSAPL